MYTDILWKELQFYNCSLYLHSCVLTADDRVHLALWLWEELVTYVHVSAVFSWNPFQFLCEKAQEANLQDSEAAVKKPSATKPAVSQPPELELLGRWHQRQRLMSEPKQA